MTSTSLSTEIITVLGQLFDEKLKPFNQRFAAIDERFDSIDRRFDAMDQRFDAVDQRFDVMDQRLVIMDDHFDRIDAHLVTIDRRLDESDRKFDILLQMHLDTKNELLQAINRSQTEIIEVIRDVIHLSSDKIDNHESRITTLERAATR